MPPSPFGHFPYDRGSFWVALKSSPVLGELPAGVRGLRIPCAAKSRPSAYFYPNRRGCSMDKRGRKDNSPLSLGNDPIALRALPLRQGKFLGCSKKLPCFRGAPRRGEGFTCTLYSKIQAFSLFLPQSKRLFHG